MKSKTFLKTSFWMTALFIFSGSLFAQLRGNGNVVEESRNVKSFTGIVVRSGIDLFLSQTGTPSVKIKTDENLQQYVITEVENDILYVYVEQHKSFWRSTALEAYVTVGDLSAVSISGGGDIEAKGTLASDNLKFDVSGGGDLLATLNSGTTALSVSGGGDAKLSGRIKELKGTITGGGDIDLNADLSLLTLNVSGGGDVDLKSNSVLSEATMTISGGGDLEMNAPANNIKLGITGGGDASVHAGDQVDHANISISGGGDLKLTLNASMLDLYVGGGGDAEISGKTATFKGEVKSGGDLSAEDLVINNASLSLTGGSGARIHVTDDLKLSASGGGQVYLKGNPHIDANMTGGAKLHR